MVATALRYVQPGSRRTLNMAIILYGGGPAFGLPEVSPFVTKTEVQLKLAGLDYEKALSRPEQSPKGQLPFIADGDERIADSTFIRLHLERKYGVDLDAGLSPRERAEAWALERMIENHLNWCSAYERFFIPGNFEKGPAHWFDAAPEAIRENLKRRLLDQVAINLKAVGVLRHSAEEIAELGEKSLAALSALLEDRSFLFGDKPCGVDATAFGALAILQSPFFEGPLQTAARRQEKLIRYVDRMMAIYYPDHPWPAPYS
jgi:glutathione S-transferase